MIGSPLRRLLETTAAEHSYALADLTVLSPAVDPFRLDTPAHHRHGKWFADTLVTLGLQNRQIHPRGAHYAFLDQPKPDDTRYINTGENWEWLEHVSNDARWLGYIPFDQIIDQRNGEPVVRIREPLYPRPYIGTGIRVDLPQADVLTPRIWAFDFEATQPYRIALVGEKSSLNEVLAPISDRFDTDLYLPTGDISNTLIYQLTKAADEDGRPLVVLYFADCDPSGWNMGIALGRKLQAFKTTHFPDLEFEVHRAGLTVDQVRQFGLPSTPLKEKERRADKWRQAFGVEQTEIDALATLRQDLLAQIAQEAIGPFYDATLWWRVTQARHEWEAQARSIVNDQLGGAYGDRVAQARQKLAAMRQLHDEINELVRLDVSDFDLPPIHVPQARLTQGLAPQPLIDSRWSWVTQTRRLIDSKNYRVPGGPSERGDGRAGGAAS